MPKKVTPSKREPTAHTDYHHGDLRRALVNEAMKLVAREGVEALTLRELARRVGVSHAAPYRHFADKNALLKELAEEGFHDLLKAMQTATARVSSPDETQKLTEVAWAYVQFALAYPERIGIMFGPKFVDQNGDQCDLKPAEETFEFVTRTIDEAKRSGRISEGDTLLQAVAAWGLAHGLSVLLINGRLRESDLGNLPPEKLVKTITSILVEGLRKRD